MLSLLSVDLHKLRFMNAPSPFGCPTPNYKERASMKTIDDDIKKLYQFNDRQCFINKSRPLVRSAYICNILLLPGHDILHGVKQKKSFPTYARHRIGISIQSEYRAVLPVSILSYASFREDIVVYTWPFGVKRRGSRERGTSLRRRAGTYSMTFSS